MRSISLTRLTRLTQRRPQTEPCLYTAIAGRVGELALSAVDVAIETGDPIGRVLATYLGAESCPDLIERILEYLEEQEIEGSIPLREVILEVTRSRCKTQRRVVAADADWVHRTELARLLCNLSIAESDLAFQDRALEHAKEALQLFRSAEQTMQGQYQADIADVLTVLASVLDELERDEEALAAAREAVTIRRSLVGEDPDEWLDLSTSLSNLGGALFALDRPFEALTAIQEALEIRESWTRECLEETMEDRGDLANQLENLGTAFEACNRSDDAIEVTTRAVESYRVLAAERPDVFRAELARSLWNLGQILASLDREAESDRVARESVHIFQELAAERPEVFAEDIPELGPIAGAGPIS